MNESVIGKAEADRGRVGFSLVELLVAVIIIAILVGLLLPALARSREESRKVNCQGVLHQVYLLTRMYSDDHDGEMPLRSVLFANGKFPDCPSNTEAQSSPGISGYSWIPYYYFRRSGEKVKIDPQWVLLGDRRPWHDPDRIWQPPPVQQWTGRHNLLYGDGRVAWIQLSSPP